MTGSFWEERLILRVLAGSRAHGVATANSDTDTRGVCIPPTQYIVGLSAFEQHSDETNDNVVYALDKFIRLALDGNPNIMEVLYTEDDDVLFVTDAGSQVRRARDLFLTRNVGERFVRYATDQLHRIQRHHRWLTAPPQDKPIPQRWGAMSDDDGRMRFPHTDAERAYRAALKEWQQYERWRAQRNPQRAELEAQHGYDTKHAMHLCRLLAMGREVLLEGTLNVRRPDAAWLRSVRDGALSYDELLAWAQPFLESLPVWLEESQLPHEPDRGAAEDLVVNLHLEALTSGR